MRMSVRVSWRDRAHKHFGTHMARTFAGLDKTGQKRHTRAELDTRITLVSLFESA